MSSSRLEKSFRLRDSIVVSSKSRSSRGITEDHMFMHILDCIGALSCIRANQKKKSADTIKERSAAALLASKHRVFWQTVREIADREAALEDIAADGYNKSTQKNRSLDLVLDCFPDDAKWSDGRMWLPLHWAVTLPVIHLSDIETIFAANPAAIKTHVNEATEFNPCFLAVMNNNPRLEIIRRLQIYYPRFGSSLDSFSATPLHRAASCSNSVEMVRELVQIHPAALKMKDERMNTPLHWAADHSDSVDVVRELAQLYPAALEVKNSGGFTPLHRAVVCSKSVEIVRLLVSLGPAALLSMTGSGKTPLALITCDSAAFENHGKLRVLLEAAPQAARMACSSDRNKLPLHQMLCKRRPPAKPEMIAMLFAAYKEAVNMSDDDGMLPIHYAARWAPLRVLKMIAEENMSNLSVTTSCGSVAHLAVFGRRLDNLRYIHAMMPELLLSLDNMDRTPLHDVIDDDDFDGSLDDLSSPFSPALDVLRFLLRHCPSLASARDINCETMYDCLPADDDDLAYARRLLLQAGASSLYPGVLQEMNYAARRTALLVFYSSAMQPSIFTRIRHAAGDKSLMRSIVSFL